ncbi:MAG: Ig-like domain-containing protein [Deltaproteobacteria bacterium]|nr:Ig-like domain-containing protein [Deltaproteobacteria bacterium]
MVNRKVPGFFILLCLTAIAPSFCPTALAEPNNPPVAVPDSATVRRNTSIAIDVLANDYDPDPGTTPAGKLDRATVTIVSRPIAGGRVAVSETGVVTYAPKRKFRGMDFFRYTVKDGEGAVSAPAKVTITVK